MIGYPIWWAIPPRMIVDLIDKLDLNNKNLALFATSGGTNYDVTINPKTGEPSKMDSAYRELLSLRKTFPTKTAVLNIYGDVNDGSHSDEDVPVNSAKSLKYLVAGRAKSYREVEIHGKEAQHSKLHNNPQVNQLLINFLWKK